MEPSADVIVTAREKGVPEKIPREKGVPEKIPLGGYKVGMFAKRLELI